jgi:hypothetical protein
MALNFFGRERRESLVLKCMSTSPKLDREKWPNPLDTVVTVQRDRIAFVFQGQWGAGDLLFFGAGPDKTSHTARYIGGGEMIHAPTHEHPMEQISRLDDQP